MSDSFANPWTIACQASVLMGLPRQENWSELPFPSPGIFPTQGSNLCLLYWQAVSLPLSHQRSPYMYTHTHLLPLVAFPNVAHKWYPSKKLQCLLNTAVQVSTPMDLVSISEPGARKYAFRYLFQVVLCVITFENQIQKTLMNAL